MAFIDELRNARSDDKLKHLHNVFAAQLESYIQSWITARITDVKESILRKVRKGEKGKIVGEISFLNRRSLNGLIRIYCEMETYSTYPKLMEGINFVHKGEECCIRTVFVSSKKKGFWSSKYEYQVRFTEAGKEILTRFKEQAEKEGILVDFSQIQIKTYDYDEDEIIHATVYCINGLDGYNKGEGKIRWNSDPSYDSSYNNSDNHACIFISYSIEL